MALNLADAECDEIKVFLEGAFFETLCVQSPQSKLVKMLLQLELYDVCIYGKESLNLGRLEVIREEKANLVLSADKVVVF